MKKILIVIALLISFPMSVWSRDCKSLLFSNLNSLGDTGLYYGAELRSQYYLVDESDELDSIFIPSAAFGLQYEAPRDIFLQFEGLARWKDNVHDCPYSEDGAYFNVRQAWAEIPLDPLTIRFGRMNIAFGNQLVLDNWFDSAELFLSIKKFDVSLFGGVLAKDVARGTSSCQHEIVYENEMCWTKICKTDWGDHKLLGATLSYSFLKSHRQKLFLMRQDTPHKSRNSDIASLYLNGKLISNLNYFVEMAYQQHETPGSSPADTIGFSGMVKGHFRSERAGLFQAGLGYLYGEKDENKPFGPIYGSLWLGERQLYMATEDRVLYVETEFVPAFSEHLKLKTLYYLQFSREDGSLESDELDVGLSFKASDKRRFWIVYSLLNIQGDLERKQQIKLETRLIF